MNINFLANNVVTKITNNTNVQWFKFKSIDNSGLEVVTTYEDLKNITCMVQAVSNQNYIHFEGTPNTKIMKCVWINFQAGGLDWAGERGQDYFVIEGIKYFVVQVNNYFNNQLPSLGWSKVTVVQTND